MPNIFGLGKISYWQGVGLFILGKLLFGGFSSSSRKSHDTGPGMVESEVRKGIRKGMEKEVCEEFGIDPQVFKEGQAKEEKMKQDELKPEKTKASIYDYNNDEKDALFERWWADKGEKAFEDYLNGEDE